MGICRSIVGIAMLSVALAANAGQLRYTDGKPCYPTEKTYYTKDGITPFGCIPAGGPAYSFRVWVRQTLVWEGVLRSDAAAVYFELPGNSGAKLVLTRDLGADPLGRSLFFGELRPSSIRTLKTPHGNIIQQPEYSETGRTFAVATGSYPSLAIGTLPGAVVANEYKLELLPL